MLRSVIGALVGREIDRRDGRGGFKGAVLGTLAARAATRMGRSACCWEGPMSRRRRMIGGVGRGFESGLTDLTHYVPFA